MVDLLLGRYLEAVRDGLDDAARQTQEWIAELVQAEAAAAGRPPEDEPGEDPTEKKLSPPSTADPLPQAADQRMFDPYAEDLSDHEVAYRAERLLRRAEPARLLPASPHHFGRVEMWQRERIAANGGTSRHLLALWAHSAAMRGRPWHQMALGKVAELALTTRPRMSELTGDLTEWGLLRRSEQGAWRGKTRPARYCLTDMPLPDGVPETDTGASVPGQNIGLPGPDTGASIPERDTQVRVTEEHNVVRHQPRTDTLTKCATPACPRPAYRDSHTGEQYDWCGRCYHSVVKPSRSAERAAHREQAVPPMPPPFQAPADPDSETPRDGFNPYTELRKHLRERATAP